MKKKISLILVLSILASLMLCKVMAVENNPVADPTAESNPEASATPSPEPSTTPNPEPSATPSPEPSATPNPEPSTTPNPEPSTTPNPQGQFTDFSKAEISLIKDSALSYVQVKNVNLNTAHTYYVKFGSNKNIDITAENSYTSLKRKDANSYITAKSVDSFIELSQDLYISILETYTENGESQSKIVVDGKKLERYNEPKYADAFFATFMSSNTTQIVTNFTHDANNQRKMQIKVGKITDVNILKKIKSSDSTGFSELLSYAKKTEGLFDKNVNCDLDYGKIAYDSGKDNKPLIEVPGLTNNEYYFLYIKTDDESGKYVSNEAVSLAQANVFTDSWYLFFYGDDKFKWSDFADATKKDDTIAPDKIIPQTGAKTLVGLTIVLAICVGGAITYAGYRKNNYK